MRSRRWYVLRWYGRTGSLSERMNSARAHLHPLFLKNSKNSKTWIKILEKIGCICIQVLHIRVNFQSKMTFYTLCAKKIKSAIEKMCIHLFFWQLILSFLHRLREMSFDPENLHECEELVYTCTQFFQEFLFMFYYFFNFSKTKGAGEPGHHSSALSDHVLTSKSSLEE